MNLGVPQRVAVTAAVVSTPGILAVARHGNAPDVGKVLRSGCSESGGGCGESLAYWFDSKGARAGQSDTTWKLTWADMAAVVLAGLTPAIAVGLAEGYRRYCNLHYEPWHPSSCRRHGRPSFACGCETNAVSDPIAYRLIWWPEYQRSSDLMRAAEADLWERAEDVLTEFMLVDAQLELALEAS